VVVYGTEVQEAVVLAPLVVPLVEDVSAQAAKAQRNTFLA